jgi:AraC-like DNA-binding protein
MLATQSLVFKSAAVPVHARVAAFNTIVRRVIPLELSTGDGQGLSIEWAAASFNGLIVSSTRFRHTEPGFGRQVARDDVPYGDLIHVRHGSVEIRQEGQSMRLGAGQWALVDAEKPKDLMLCSDASEMNGARVPWLLLLSRLREPRQHFGRPFDAQTGLCAIAADFLHSLAHRREGIPQRARALLATQFVDLLAMALTAPESPLPFAESRVRQALFTRICDFVDRHFTNPELTPRMIAAGNGISERYLFKLFQDSGSTVAEHVRRQRLTACRRALEDPQQPCRSIAEIAYANGLSSPSRLTKAFRREFGMTPRAARESARAQLSKASFPIPRSDGHQLEEAASEIMGAVRA